MNMILNLTLLVVGFLSFIPVVQMINAGKNTKYKCLKYLVISTFIWTLIVFTERFSTNLTMTYYAHMMGYPLKFLMSGFMLCTIYNYVEKRLPLWQTITLGILFLAELIIALTNATTQYIVQVTPSEMVSFQTLYEADKGLLFMYHLIITYLVLLIAIVYLILFLRKHKEVRSYQLVTRTMVYSVLVVLVFNSIQIFGLKSYVDLTYISLVIVVYALYIAIYRKDMSFNLKASGRGEILSNMREMYIITDSEKRIVEISHLLQSKYDIDQNYYEGISLQQLLDDLTNKIVFYTEYEVNEDADAKKDHFHLREKKFTLKGMNEYGYMILLYDETQVFSLLRELNRLSNFDTMTGLHNRNYIEHKLTTYSDKDQLGVISLDLNGLKANNDYLGHERGDFLLRSLAQKMKEALKDVKYKEIARIGGDEFMIIIPDTTSSSLENYKNEILTLCDSSDLLQKISVSIGYSSNEESKHSVYELIKEADKKMYDMKQKTSKEYSLEIVKYATKKDKYIR